MVSLEIAFGTVGLAAVVYLIIGVVGLILVQIRCVDAASELAREAARGDQAAVAQIADALPDPASVTWSDTADLVRVHVAIPCRPWGSWLVELTVTADAETRKEVPT
jgi:hypothetical protein